MDEAAPAMAPMAFLPMLVVLETPRGWIRIARDRELPGDILSATKSLNGMATVLHVQDGLVQVFRMIIGGETEFTSGHDQTAMGLVFEGDTGSEQP